MDQVASNKQEKGSNFYSGEFEVAEIPRQKSTALSSYVVIDGESEIDIKQLDQLTKETELSQEFLDRHKFELDWKLVCEYQKLSEQLLTKFKEFIKWPLVSRHQKLTLPFIEDFKHLIDWETALKFQQVPEVCGLFA